jgi:hypothetical protein
MNYSDERYKKMKHFFSDWLDSHQMSSPQKSLMPKPPDDRMKEEVVWLKIETVR